MKGYATQAAFYYQNNRCFKIIEELFLGSETAIVELKNYFKSKHIGDIRY